MAKKYFWLKLKDDFFQDKRIKKLRRVAGGDTYTVIYLKMQLLSLKNEGILKFEGVENTFYEEIALEIDEDEENVQFTLMFLEKNGLIEEIQDNEFALIETMSSIGTESQSAERVRRHRELKKEQKALQCNTDVTICNTEIEKEIEKEKENIKPSSQKFSTSDMENAELLFSLMLENNPDAKKPNLEKWANEFRLIRTSDKREDKTVKYLLNWCQKDSFWKSNILSPSKFRKQWDQLYMKAKQEFERAKNPVQPKQNKPWEELAYGTETNSSTYDDYSKQLPNTTKQIGW